MVWEFTIQKNIQILFIITKIEVELDEEYEPDLDEIDNNEKRFDSDYFPDDID
jgi:hypothetical protein